MNPNSHKGSVCKIWLQPHSPRSVLNGEKSKKFKKGNESPKDRMIGLKLSTVLRLSQKSNFLIQDFKIFLLCLFCYGIENNQSKN